MTTHFLHATLLPASPATEPFFFSKLFPLVFAIPDDHSVYLPHRQLLSLVESTGSLVFIVSQTVFCQLYNVYFASVQL